MKYYKYRGKEKENQYVFLSLEFIEDKINIINSSSNNRKLHEETVNDDDKTNLSHLFDCYIKDQSFGLCLKNRNEIKWYQNILNIPFHNEDKNDKINEIYKINEKLESLSFYNCFEDFQQFNKNSILFTKSIKDEEDLSNLKKILEEKEIKVIITNDLLVNENIIEKFIIENNIPIYYLPENSFNRFINFFIKGIGGNYIDIINYKVEMENSSSIVDIYKFDLFIKDKKEKEEKKEKINHKKKRSMDSDEEKSNSEDNNNSNNNSNIDLDEDKYNYETPFNSNDPNEQRMKKYKELIDNIDSFYCLANVKIIKRLIFDIICLDKIQIEELEKNLNNEEKVFILEALCLEYYFNIQYNLSNNKLKEKLKQYLRIISKDWINQYFHKYTDEIINNISIINNDLSLFDINNFNNLKKLIEENSKSFCYITYDKLLYILKEFLN